ncbi:E3 ubiquitin-protein ligase HRD1 [Phytophthora nicotianae]|uniref:E3 ubiquitin-protein ligase HRD1 n=1 Tax=Phytophthora nicotianae TaxID=4792 RepID=A0A0W8CW10_PHYNI|nr:E3 ubiquitin-protein ligase HRD1 [Phytophthora nicotianae]
MREPSEEVLRVGDEFSSSKTALHAIQDYALAERKRVVVDSQGGGHKLVACSSKTCNFFVRLYKRKNPSDDGVSPPWYISSMNLEPMNCTSQPKPTQRQVAEMSALRAAVLADASVSGKSLIKKVQAINMVNLAKQKRMVYRAADAIKENAQGDVTASFTKIPGLLRAFRNLNPGSHACCEVDDVGRFDRAVVVPATSSRAEGHLQKIVGLDGAHSKHQRYNGTMLLLIGRDGNMENVTLAVALVKKETMENYEWFFQQCCLGGLKFAYPLMSDRNTGLIDVCKQRGIDHKYCTLHIQRNVIATFTKFTVKQKALVWRIQSCTSMEIGLQARCLSNLCVGSFLPLLI